MAEPGDLALTSAGTQQALARLPCGGGQTFKLDLVNKHGRRYVRREDAVDLRALLI